MRLILLDRDGVINYDSDEYIKSADEWHPIPGSLEAIARLNQADYRVIIITNQSGLARGLFTLDDLHQIHAKMFRHLAEVGGYIEAIFFCAHAQKDNCTCRKPQAGLFKDIINRFGTPLADVPAVGDSLRDLQAAMAVNAQPILVLTGKGQKTFTQLEDISHISVYNNLASVVDDLLKGQEF